MYKTDQSVIFVLKCFKYVIDCGTRKIQGFETGKIDG